MHLTFVLASFRDIFHQMDSSGDNKLDMNELRGGLENIGINMSDQDYTHVWRVADKDNSGEVTYDEFLKIFGRQDYLTDEKGFGSVNYVLESIINSI
jgi:Ca2+-binding EF-hand superfamily protein